MLHNDASCETQGMQVRTSSLVLLQLSHIPQQVLVEPFRICFGVEISSAMLAVTPALAHFCSRKW